MRDPKAFVGRTPNPPTCPVLSVPPWFYDMVELGALISKGRVGLSEVSSSAWSVASVSYTELVSAKRAAAEAQAKQDAAIRRALGKGPAHG